MAGNEVSAGGVAEGDGVGVSVDLHSVSSAQDSAGALLNVGHRNSANSGVSYRASALILAIKCSSDMPDAIR